MKDNLIFLKHILESIKDLEEFTKGVDKQALLNNKEKQSAVIRQIEIIGEAAKNISKDFKKKYISVPWKEIIGTRDKLIHHYFGVDFEILWKVVERDIPNLKNEISKILKQ
jgi:uncharacterized protein with HEPN domain